MGRVRPSARCGGDDLKPVLVDTSVWRRYFAGAAGVKALGGLLDEDGAVLVHPFVIGEMVLGGLSARRRSSSPAFPRRSWCLTTRS